MLEAMPVKKLAAAGRPIVRVLPQPIYDTEQLDAGAARTQVVFYSRPLGQADQSGNIASKTLQHTNIKQPGSLAKPYEFDLFSFNLKIFATVATPITAADLLRCVQSGYAEFTLGNRVYLDVPLIDIPCGVFVEGYDPSAALAPMVHNGVAHRSNAWKFTVGKFLVHIRSTESFQVTLNWATAITPVLDVNLQWYMNGLMYNAI